MASVARVDTAEEDFLAPPKKLSEVASRVDFKDDGANADAPVIARRCRAAVVGHFMLDEFRESGGGENEPSLQDLSNENWDLGWENNDDAV